MHNNKPKVKPEIDLPHIKMPEDPLDGREIFDDLFNVASGMECTGLIPSAPYSAAEVESYSHIYDIPLRSDSDCDKPRDREPTAVQDGSTRGRTGRTQISEKSKPAARILPLRRA